VAPAAQPPLSETPLRSRGTALHWQTSVSPEGWTPPRARFRLTRGPDTPSGEVPPRSRAGRPPSGEAPPRSGAKHPLEQGSASLEDLVGSLPPYLLPRQGHLMHWHFQAPRSKTNPRHAPDTPGNHAPALFRQLPRWGHPRHCAALCGVAGVSPVTLCRPLSYGWRAAPSKQDGGTLKGGTNAYSTLAQDCAVTSGQRDRSPPSPSVLCGHPRHHDTIPGTASPSPALGKRAATGHRHARCCASYSLPSAAPSNQHAGGHRTSNPYTATLEATPGWIQGTPWRPARREIRQDGRLLHGVVRHTSTDKTVQHACKLPPPWPIKGGVVPWPQGDDG
jgi:hypothetical protein